MSDKYYLLSEDDSERVADSLVYFIENELGDHIESAIKKSISSCLNPNTKRMWKEDWLPLTIEEMCDKISNGVVNAAYAAAEKINISN